jgi:hypothetical protein
MSSEKHESPPLTLIIVCFCSCPQIIPTHASSITILDTTFQVCTSELTCLIAEGYTSGFSQKIKFLIYKIKIGVRVKIFVKFKLRPRFK